MLDSLPTVPVPMKLIAAWDRTTAALPHGVRNMIPDNREWPENFFAVEGDGEADRRGRHKAGYFVPERGQGYFNVAVCAQMDDEQLDHLVASMIANVVLVLIGVDVQYLPLMPEVMATSWLVRHKERL